MAEQTQALAGLRVMAAVAKADGHLAEEERKQIADALAELAPDVSVETILEDVDLDAVFPFASKPQIAGLLHARDLPYPSWIPK